MAQVEEVAVPGAGDMGHGIAELAALHAFDVQLQDVQVRQVGQALQRIESSPSKLVDDGQIAETMAHGRPVGQAGPAYAGSRGRRQAVARGGLRR